MKKKTLDVDPVGFLKAMREWQDRGKQFSDQDELCFYYYKLAEKTVPFGGSGHIDPDDLIQWCVLSCCQKSKYFDESRGTCFNFFTRVILNKIAVVYKSENKKFNPKVHTSIDDEYSENTASIACIEYDPKKAREFEPRPITSAIDFLKSFITGEPDAAL